MPNGFIVHCVPTCKKRNRKKGRNGGVGCVTTTKNEIATGVGKMSITQPDVDDYREVKNGSMTYAAIAEQLREHQCCVVGWTDEHHSHLDILFTLSPPKFGSLQGGLRGGDDLFVSIMRRGCFAFDVCRTDDLHPGYVAEKLGETNNVTINVLTTLINGVLEQLGPARTSP